MIQIFKDDRRLWWLVASGVIVALGSILLVSTLVSRGTSSGKDPGETGTASSGGRGAGKGGTPAKGGGPAGGSGSSPGQEPTTSSADPYPPDYVAAGISTDNPDDPQPQGCDLYRGNVCKIHFKGRYRLVTQEGAIIRVAAYEDGRSEPSQSADLTVPKGSSQWFVDLAYPVGKNARTVQFKAMLVSPEGKILYQRDEPPAYTFKIKDPPTPVG